MVNSFLTEKRCNAFSLVLLCGDGQSQCILRSLSASGDSKFARGTAVSFQYWSPRYLVEALYLARNLVPALSIIVDTAYKILKRHLYGVSTNGPSRAALWSFEDFFICLAHSVDFEWSSSTFMIKKETICLLPTQLERTTGGRPAQYHERVQLLLPRGTMLVSPH